MSDRLPNFYTIIPAFVRYNTELSDFDKLLYGEITALTNANNYCWATNTYFARVFNKSESTITRSVARLIKANVIHSYIDTKNGNTRYLSLKTPISKNAQTPKRKNAHTSHARPNKELNNTSNNTKVTPPRTGWVNPKARPIDTNVDWFDDYLKEIQENN